MIKVEKNGVIKAVSKELAKHYVKAGWVIVEEKKIVVKNIKEND